MSALLIAGLRRVLRSLAAIAFDPPLPRALLLRAYVPLLVRQAAALLRPGLARAPGVAWIEGHAIRYGSLVDVVFAFEETFVGGQYRFDAATAEPSILDCGSNVGLSVLFFKLRYPGAHVLAFEPSPATWPLLVANVGDLPGVRLEQKALAAADGTLAFYAAGAGDLRASTVAHDDEEPAASVECVPLSRFVTDEVDLLKLDVEGREREVLAELAASGALERIHAALVEVHGSSTDVAAASLLLRDAGFAVAQRDATAGAVLLSAVRAHPAG